MLKTALKTVCIYDRDEQNEQRRTDRDTAGQAPVSGTECARVHHNITSHDSDGGGGRAGASWSTTLMLTIEIAEGSALLHVYATQRPPTALSTDAVGRHLLTAAFSTARK